MNLRSAIASLALSLVPLIGQNISPISREGAFWTQTVSGSLPASPLTRLRIQTEGAVSVRGSETSHIVYVLKRRTRARTAAEAENVFHDLLVKTRPQGQWVWLVAANPKRRSYSAELTVEVPRALRQAWIETLGGAVQAADLSGEVQAQTGGGRVDIDRIGASAVAKSGGGEIRVGRVLGGVRCYSAGGGIRVESAGLESWFETAGGDIYIREARGPVHASTAGGNIHVERSASEVYAHTAGGVIEIDQAGGQVTADTSGGAIAVTAARNVRCQSTAGLIRLRNVGGALRATTASGSILALVTGGRIEDSLLSTASGDITVFLASNIALTIQARNESAGNAGKIVSDFPEIQVKKAGVANANPALAEGALNGGGPVLRIVASGGTIYLRRQK